VLFGVAALGLLVGADPASRPATCPSECRSEENRHLEHPALSIKSGAHLPAALPSMRSPAFKSPRSIPNSNRTMHSSGRMIARRPEPRIRTFRLTRALEHSSCGFAPRVKIRLALKGTPIVGRELPLEVVVTNNHKPGGILSWIVDPSGALEPVDGPLEWTDSVESGQTITHLTSVRVLASEPFSLIGKSRMADSPRWGSLDPETALRVYPYAIRNGAIVARWSESSGSIQGLSTSQVIPLPDGGKALLLPPLSGPVLTGP